MQIPLTDIYVSPDERIRYETFGNIKELAESIQRFGQGQDIAIRPSGGPQPYKLVDGGRRLLAVQLLDARGLVPKNCEPGHIGCKVLDIDDDMLALVMEYRANEDRMDFSWKERLGFIRRMHEGYSARHDDWTQADTARNLGLTQSSVSRYLSLIENPDVFNDEEVQGADSLNTALKKADIVKERLHRKQIVRLRNQQILKARPKEGKDASLDSDEVPDATEPLVPSEGVFNLLSNDDLLDWLPSQPDSHFDWFHWDPPYGAEQSGGAFASHKAIDDTQAYAFKLLELGIPEIHRALRDGCWLALWHHPDFAHEIKLYLQGHVRSPDGATCRYCEKLWPTFESPGTLANGCPAGEWSFWVNPYPVIWYKHNRQSDGHDIKRFLTNQYEQFYLAGKIGTDLPILPNTSGPNVLVHDVPSREERRHIMHKPWPLLTDVLSIISNRGEFGGDCSVGSGSILEAAIFSGRLCSGTELDHDAWVGATFAFERARRAAAESGDSS